MRFSATVCAMVLTLAGCATAPDRTETFEGSSAHAYVLAGIPLDANESHTLSFRRVDMTTTTFQDKIVYIRVGPNSADRWKGVPEDRDEAAAMRFGGRRLPPGDYALVAHSVSRFDGVTTTTEYVNCYALGAPIYRLQQGAINLMLLKRFVPGWLSKALVTIGTRERDTAPLQAAADRFLAGYPNLTAPRVVVDPIAAARFETAEKQCNVPQAFSFVGL